MAVALRAAVSSLERRDPVGALEQLTASWREVPAPTLGMEIDRLGAKLTEPLPPLGRDTQQHAAWLERFAQQQPADLPLLVRAAFEPTSGKRTLQRLECLLELPRDPRFTGPLVEWCAQNANAEAWMAGEASVWTRVLRLLVRQADPRATVALRSLQRSLREQLEGSGPRQRMHLQELEAKIGRAVRALPQELPDDPPLPALAAAVEAFVQGPPVPLEVAYPNRTAVVDQVRDQIYEDPDDDGPIEVWADLLTEAGDPLGRFVTLQLAESRKPLRVVDQKLSDRLQKTLTSRLLGPLAPLVDPKSAGFQRGLLHAARVLKKSSGIDDSLLDHPYWRSVRFVHTSNKHLQRDALAGVTATGVRLVPTLRNAYGDPPGYRFRRAPAPGWSQLSWLASRPDRLALHTVCAALPKQIPSVEHLEALESPRGLGQLQTLHLVESLSWPQMLSMPSLVRRLGGLAENPWLRTVPHLILDGVSARWVDLPLLHIWALLRGTGQRLTLFEELSWIAQLTEREGLHLDLTVRTFYRHHLGRLQGLIPDPGAFASITVRCAPLPAREHQLVASVLAGCSSVSLPGMRRS